MLILFLPCGPPTSVTKFSECV